MNNYNDKFVYKEKEIKIVKSQCDLCLYNDLKKIIYVQNTLKENLKMY